jgi:transposase
MLTIPASVRIFLCQEATDLRKGFESLCALTESLFNEPPTNGAYFVFLNRRRNRMKVLYWDNDGLAIWYKRLEKGGFPKSHFTGILIDRRCFLMMLEGIIPKRLKNRFHIP